MLTKLRRRYLLLGGVTLAIIAAVSLAGAFVYSTLGGVKDPFPSSSAGLPDAGKTQVVVLEDGATYVIRAHSVQGTIGQDTVKMLAYNGSVPGPTLRVPQGAYITVTVVNDLDFETTVHWHALRLENAYDGVPFDTQAPIPPGGRFDYRLSFPDAGVYWYHPHLREDYGQEMGLYGNIIVVPSDAGYWPDVDREVAITLDDVLVSGGEIAPFSQSEPNHVAMGRFGNTMLTRGQTAYEMTVQRGDVVRLYLTNTANTRVFNVHFPDAKMKLIGGDNGRYERETFVDSVLLAPSERVVADVLFDQTGRLTMEHRTPDRAYALGTIHVSERTGQGRHAATFHHLRVNEEFAVLRPDLSWDMTRPADKTIALVGTMPGMGHHGDVHQPDGIEWEDTMPRMNRGSTPANMFWEIIDTETGAANHAIAWSFEVGDRVKIRIENEPDSDHPMQHPFHIHGQRFLVLSRNGASEDNLVWKDTVLVRTGEAVDILMEATNPGIWMAHCHISEHAESGMMFNFQVGDTVSQHAHHGAGHGHGGLVHTAR